jgi:integrase
MTKRFQKGCIWRKKSHVGGKTVYGSTWYIRYQTDSIVDGRSVRTQKNEVLCAVDRIHSSPTCKAVKDLAAKFMERVNGNVGNGGDMLVPDFWETVYLPFVTETKKPSTVSGYKQIWGQHLSAHFAGRTFQSYQTHEASSFLSALAKTQGRATLSHVRSLMSGVFTHAINLGRLKTNPMREAKILAKVSASKPTSHYSLEEVEHLVSALVESPMCQSMLALAFFAGLRPSEIVGLQWGDIDIPNACVHIRRACVHGHVGTTKTPESVATLPLLPQVIVPLALWKQKSSDAREVAWVFPNGAGNPVDIQDIVKRFIRPAVAKAAKENAEIQWKGFYAARRGAATSVVQLTGGNAQAAAALLRHKTMAVTFQHYVKLNQTALTDGLKALGAAATPGSNDEANSK